LIAPVVTVAVNSGVVEGERRSPKYFWGNAVPSNDIRTIIETVATRCHILKLKYTKFNFGWGFARSLQRSPDFLAGFRGGLLLRVGKGRKDGREGQGGVGKGR